MEWLPARAFTTAAVCTNAALPSTLAINAVAATYAVARALISTRAGRYCVDVDCLVRRGPYRLLCPLEMAEAAPTRAKVRWLRS